MIFFTTLKSLYLDASESANSAFESLSLLFMRLLVARIFITSGLSKWNGWFDFDEQKYDLFLYEFFWS